MPKAIGTPPTGNAETAQILRWKTLVALNGVGRKRITERGNFKTCAGNDSKHKMFGEKEFAHSNAITQTNAIITVFRFIDDLFAGFMIRRGFESIGDSAFISEWNKTCGTQLCFANHCQDHDASFNEDTATIPPPVIKKA